MSIKNENDFINREELIYKFITVLNGILEQIQPIRLFPQMLYDDKFKKIIINQKNIDVKRNIYLLGFGKAAFSMTQAFLSLLESYSGFKIKKGILIGVKEDHNPKFEYNKYNLETFFGTHPDITEANLKATKEAIKLIDQISEDDILVTLISGGGSALFEYPLSNIQETEIIKLNSTLVTCGANIDEMNLVRKAFSSVKGGRLYHKCNGNILNFIISDVPSNNASTIASGPTIPQEINFKDMEEVIRKYHLNKYISVKMLTIAKRNIEEDKARLKVIKNRQSTKENYTFVLGGSRKLREISENLISKAKFGIPVLSIFMNSSIEEVVTDIIRNIRDIKEKSIEESEIIIIGTGETTINIKSEKPGVGGRNQHLVALLALQLVELEKNTFLEDWIISAFATDGIDGNSNIAGAILNKKLFKSNNNAKKELLEEMKNYNTSTFFLKTKSAILTGRTGTNCADLFIGYFKL